MAISTNPSKTTCVGDPQDHLQIQRFSRKTHGTLHKLVLITAKEHKTKSAKGKGAWGEVQAKPGTSFQEFSPSGVTQDI